MTNQATKLLLVVCAGVIAGASIASISVTTAAAAAGECLAKPKDGAHPGQHWYYRTDRGSKRQCWYLRDKDDASPQAAVPASSEKKASVERNNDSALTRSTANAYAAFSSPVGRFQSDAQIPPVTQTSDATADEQDPSHDASAASEQSAVATRWPDPAAVLSPAIERTVPSSSELASATPDPSTQAAPEGPQASPNAADTSSNVVSLQMLLLAAFGALAFSGLTGGAIYFARTRRRPDEATSRWPGWSPPDDAYRQYAPLRPATAVNSPRDAEARPVERLTGDLNDNGQEIAQLLARFTHQAQAER